MREDCTVPLPYVLDQVVKQISREEYRSLGSADSHQTVCLDRRTKEAKKVSIVSWNPGNSAYYVVYNSNDKGHFAQSSIENYAISDFPSGTNLGFTVDYRVTCAPGNEERAAKALFDNGGNSPGKVFEDQLLKCLDESWHKQVQPQSNAPGSLLDAMDSWGLDDLERLRRAVQECICKATYLEVTVRLTLDNSTKLTPLDLDGIIQVRALDSDEVLEVKYKASLIVDPGRWIP